ncbi:RNA polymerase sigma factor [Microlunatus aurantiacus]|uniref:RNA polymerase sigma factor n=1 Tax=Microlunatus aurantiacus TaxID=446786 RepID=A0ABP7EC89_9ACTN
MSIARDATPRISGIARTVPPGEPAVSADLPVTHESLTDRLRRGSRAAMSTVFTEHVDTIYNYCRRRTGSWSAAEDLTSAVFLEVWRCRRRAVELDGSVLPWLYGVATNVCRNHSRSVRRRSSAMARLELVEGSRDDLGDATGDHVAGQLDSDRRVRAMIDRLSSLAAADRDVFLLVCWEGLSYPQTAQALGIPVGTVKSRLSRVRRELRLADPDGADGGLSGPPCDLAVSPDSSRRGGDHV